MGQYERIAASYAQKLAEQDQTIQIARAYKPVTAKGPFEKLSGEWYQIQIASSIEGVKRDAFARDSNIIVCPMNLEGDFKELTAYLLDQPYQMEKNRPPRRLREEEGYPLTMTELGREMPELSPAGQKAAKEFYKIIDQTLTRARCEETRIYLQGPWYRSADQNWHTDGFWGRRVGCRVSGGMTEIAHTEDVLKVRSGANDGTSDVIDNPRCLTLKLGDVWANRAGQIGMIDKIAARLEGRIPASTHRKAEPCGIPGLIFTTNIC